MDRRQADGRAYEEAALIKTTPTLDAMPAPGLIPALYMQFSFPV